MHFNLFWHFSQSHTVECRVSWVLLCRISAFSRAFFWLSFFFDFCSLLFLAICIPRRVFYMSKEFRASNSCIQVESVPLQSVPDGGRGRLRSVGVAVCLKGSKYFCDVSIVNAERRLTIKERNKNEKYDRVAEHYDGRSPWCQSSSLLTCAQTELLLPVSHRHHCQRRQRCHILQIARKNDF